MSIPLRGVINVTNISNSNGSSLTLNILCTRNSHHCLRTLSACAHHQVARTRGTRMSRVHCIPTTLTLRRQPNIPKVHSAFNAVARLLGDLHLVFSQLSRCPYPTYNYVIPPDLGVTTRVPLCYPQYNTRIPILNTRRFTFGDAKTYPDYRNANVIQIISRSALIPSRDLSVGRNTILP